MHELCTLGSERGAPSNGRPYRNPPGVHRDLGLLVDRHTCLFAHCFVRGRCRRPLLARTVPQDNVPPHGTAHSRHILRKTDSQHQGWSATIETLMQN